MLIWTNSIKNKMIMSLLLLKNLILVLIFCEFKIEFHNNFMENIETNKIYNMDFKNLKKKFILL